LRKIYQEHPDTTIAVCTKKGSEQVNQIAADVLVGRRRELVKLPGDYDANMENFEKGKLKTDQKPVPSVVSVKKGLRLYLTRNVDKEGDFVNGMACTVLGWDDHSRCLQVRTKTGKRLAVFQYTDPDPKAQNCSFFPVRLGYASTVYKLQGAELTHVTIYIDAPGQRAAAYVAMSRIRKDEDYLFGGKYSRKHFVPNV